MKTESTYMKTETIKHVAADELRSQINQMINEEQASAGIGAVSRVSEKIGANYSNLSGFLAGRNGPGEKALEFFKLEPRTVYALKSQGK